MLLTVPEPLPWDVSIEITDPFASPPSVFRLLLPRYGRSDDVPFDTDRVLRSPVRLPPAQAPGRVGDVPGRTERRPASRWFPAQGKAHGATSGEG